MAEKKLDPRPFFVIGLIIVIAGGGFVLFSGSGETHNYYEFASCLAEHNATMYGFDACPHCNKQKTIIGQKAFKQEIDKAGYYVRCRPQSEATEKLGDRADRIATVAPLQPNDTQSDACSANVGAGTPTWVIDGKKYVGEQSIEDLAEATGCPLPANYTDQGNVGGFTPQNGTE